MNLQTTLDEKIKFLEVYRDKVPGTIDYYVFNDIIEELYRLKDLEK